MRDTFCRRISKGAWNPVTTPSCKVMKAHSSSRRYSISVVVMAITRLHIRILGAALSFSTWTSIKRLCAVLFSTSDTERMVGRATPYPNTCGFGSSVVLYAAVDSLWVSAIHYWATYRRLSGGNWLWDVEDTSHELCKLRSLITCRCGYKILDSVLMASS